jgi:hypothetical protein
MQLELLERLSRTWEDIFWRPFTTTLKFAAVGLLLLTFHHISHRHNAAFCLQLYLASFQVGLKATWLMFCNLNIKNSYQQSNNGPEPLVKGVAEEDDEGSKNE